MFVGNVRGECSSGMSVGNDRRIKSGEKIRKVMSRCSVQIDVGGMMFKGNVRR